MPALAKRKYWDYIHSGENKRFEDGNLTTEAFRFPAENQLKAALKKLLGPKLRERMSAYDDYLLWDVILPKFLPNIRGAKFIEIGSAPGDYSVQFSKRFGCIPYGVEYSEGGVKLNREVFKENSFNPDNVIHADFFSDEFIARHQEKFDGVMSKGFIEHFDDVKSVIDRHMRLLKPGGHLIVTIPNLSGVNYVLAGLLDEGAIPRHNVTIMKRKVYRDLFQRSDLQPLFCDYYGTFSFYLFTAPENSARQKQMLTICHKFQPVLNFMFRTIFGKRGAENGWFSPFLLYIGRKAETPS
jgi:2-polyprenyl-3-methyl-5-hydroxy-6-metoxy-1,4-benzoquinol methylase